MDAHGLWSQLWLLFLHHWQVEVGLMVQLGPFLCALWPHQMGAARSDPLRGLWIQHVCEPHC